MWYYFNGIYGITFYIRIFENIFEKIKTLSPDFTSRGHKGGDKDE